MTFDPVAHSRSGLQMSSVLLSINTTHLKTNVCVSGILSGGSRGGLLPRQCIHRWSAAYAGND